MILNEILLSLFTIFTGIAFGAGLYEARIVIPLWFDRTGRYYIVNHENLSKIDSGRKFWGFITTVPLTLLTIANLVLAFHSSGEVYNWWLAPSVILLAERIMTFSFFIPTIIKLQKDQNLDKEVVSQRIARWVNLNYVRNTLTLVAWLLALKALMMI